MAASITLFGNDENFWTSEDESDVEDDGAVSVEDSSETTVTERSNYIDHPPLAKLLEFEDPTATDAFVSGPSPIPECTIVPPKPNMIRKNWVIHDNSPVDTWEQDIPDLAVQFPFTLDAFQKRAIRHVHRREHTFVAAHTSAGKTVVAEYAIAVAAKRGRRAIYTSPIKALSNQKFREFKKTFDSVGIITGDVSLNPEAQCLIATTEILRSMLYRGDAILHQLDVVIFDEVHYVNDAERGVVWEEVIIMLPRDVCLVMLSATVPNYREFADWIGRTKRREVFAVATSKRPTPLKHFLWANDKEFLVMDQAKFRVEAFNELYKHRREAMKTPPVQGGPRRGGGGRGTQRGGGPSNQSKQFGSSLGNTLKKPGGAKLKTDAQRLQSLILRLEQSDQLPVVVFCFSRRKCEAFPSAMGKVDLLHQQDERSKVHVFIKESFSSLSDSDRELPQVVQVSAFLSRGIGIHHGGLLPIVKEAVEILFAKGVVKVLFATETFAMGVNMPARSVVFASLEKHDGQRVRTLYSSEYTQMAGRAGRRGLDSFGSVYILCQSDEPPDQKAVTRMMMEKASLLESRFRLTFGMLLQLAGQHTLKAEDMMSLSFREYSRARRLPTLKRDRTRLLKELATIKPLECIFGVPQSMNRYAELEFKSRHLASNLHRSLWKHQYSIASTTAESKASPPFCRGRVVLIHSVPSIRCSSPAAIIGVEPPVAGELPRFRVIALTLGVAEPVSQPSTEDPSLGFALERTLDVPLAKKPTSSVIVAAAGDLRESVFLDSYEPGAAFGYVLLSGVPLSSIGLVTGEILAQISALEELNQAMADHRPIQQANLLLAATALDRLNVGLKAQWTPMTFSKQLRSVEIEFIDTLLEQKDTTTEVNRNTCHSCALKDEHFELVCHRRKCETALEELQTLLGVESLYLYDDMKLYYKLLEQRQYIDSRYCITLKGQVAAALTTNDDITLTEALLANVLHDKTPNEVAALLSCFVFPDKVQEVSLGPTQGIADGRAQIEAIHSDLEKQMKFLGIPVVHEDWWRICNFGLSLVAFQWARGDSFASIMESTEIQEGTIVRAILRLDELIRKIRSVAKTFLDDPNLEKLMEDTSQKIRRDVVFAMSLYLK